MIDVLTTIGVAVAGKVIGAAISEAIDWIKGRTYKPSPAVVQQKVEALVAQNLPDTVPTASRKKAIAVLTEIVIPTLAQIKEFSPNTARIMEVARTPTKASTKFSRSGWGSSGGRSRSVHSTSKKTAAGRAPNVKTTAKKLGTTKSVARKVPSKKSAGPKKAR